VTAYNIRFDDLAQLIREFRENMTKAAAVEAEATKERAQKAEVEATARKRFDDEAKANKEFREAEAQANREGYENLEKKMTELLNK